ncbi:MAG: hypothetical protein WAN46_16785 [Gammaproteobacteria bacterium]
MATIQKRVGRDGDITYRVRVRVQGQYRAASFHRKTDAKDWANRIESDIKRGRCGGAHE